MERHRLVPAALVVLVATSAGPHAQEPASPGAGLLERFLADTEGLASFEGYRCLSASNDRLRLTGAMQVRVSLSPSRGFAWAVVAEDGSDQIRDRVLRAALEAERALVASGASARASLSPDNYVMTLETDSRATGVGTAVLWLSPRRRDRLLIEGAALLTDPEADLLEVRGRVARNPSWWTTSVDVVRRYARVAGIRVPVEMTSTASVRLVGRSRFRMVTTYSVVNGRPVGQPAGAAGCAPPAEVTVEPVRRAR